MGLFGRLKSKLLGSGNTALHNIPQERGQFGLGRAIKNLIDQDAESSARGEIPERRLIPHHAIKRDVILAAYEKDFQTAIDQMKSLNWVEAEKKRRICEMRLDFEKHIFGVMRLTWQDLDKIIELMKNTRTDLKEIEQDIRSKNPIYSIVDPL